MKLQIGVCLLLGATLVGCAPNLVISGCEGGDCDACEGAPAGCGQPCSGDEACNLGLVCVNGRCVPPQDPGDTTVAPLLKLTLDGPSSIPTGSCVTFAVTALDGRNAPVRMPSATALSLSGNGDGAFYLDAACTQTTTLLTFEADRSNALVSFADASVETLLLSVAAPGASDGLKSVNVVQPIAGASKLGLAGSAVLEVDACGAYTVSLLAANNAPATLTQPVDIALGGAGAGTFYADPECQNPSSSTSVAAGQSAITVFFAAPGPEVLVLRASSATLGSADLPLVVRAVNADPALPVLGLTPPAGPLAGGASVTVAYAVVPGTVPLQTLTLELALDGATFTTDRSLPTTSGSFTWPVPLVDVPAARLRLVGTVGGVSETSTVTSPPFAIDSTPPDAPLVTLASATPTNDPLVSATLASCVDVAEMALMPDAFATPEGFAPCSTDAGALTLALGPDGAYDDLRAFAKDAAGNLSPPSDALSVLLDTLPPTGALEPVPSALPVGLSVDLDWSAIDTNLDTVEVQWLDGGTWTTVCSDTSGAEAGTCSYLVPDRVGVSALRLIARDVVPNEAILAELPFEFDHSTPTISTLDFRVQGDPTTNPPLPVASPFARFDFSASDDVRLTAFCLKLVYSPATPPAPAPGNGCWRRFDDPLPGLTPGPALDVLDYPFRLGFLPSPLYVRLWVRDESGRVSASAVRQADYDPGTPPVIDNVFATTTHAPCSPPSAQDLAVPSDEAVVIKWFASYSNGPAASGAIALDYTTDGLSFTPIPGAEALDNAEGAGCTLVPSGANAVCPAGPFESTPKSGCFLWGPGASKPADFLGIRVRAVDAKGLSSVRSAVPPLNAYDRDFGDPARRLRFLAGNPDPGIGGSALGTVINNRLIRRYGTVDVGSLAVNSRGVVFLRDRDNGILWINPENGDLERLGRLGASSSGDDGPASEAVWRSLHFITVDFADRLLVWDYNRIRRVEVDADGRPTTVHAFVGGGAVLDGQDVAPADVALGAECAACDILPMPNGDVFFPYYGYYRMPDYGRIWRYRDAGLVDAVQVQGTGYSTEPSRNLDDCTWTQLHLEQDVASETVVRLHAKTAPNVYSSTCTFGVGSFDENGVSAPPFLPDLPPYGPYGTQYFSGLDGQLYGWDYIVGGGVSRFNRATWTWERLLGDGTRPDDDCPEGAEAAECRAEVHALFVDVLGNLYFISSGTLRVIVTSLEDDGAGGLVEKRRVRTLAGQGLYYGDGGDALSARFSMIVSAKPWSDGGVDKLMVMDVVNSRLREVTVGGAVTTIAGDGRVAAPAMDVDATTTGIAPWLFTTMGVEETTGRVFTMIGHYQVNYLERSAGTWMWRRLAGGGTVPYASAADGETSVALGSLQYFALTPTEVLFTVYTVDSGLFPSTGGWGDALVFAFRLSDGAMYHFMGVPGPNGPFCADGTPRTDCGFPISYGFLVPEATFDPGGAGTADDRYIMSEAGTAYSYALRTVPISDPLGPIGTLTSLPALNERSFVYVRRADQGGAEIVYHCTPQGTLSRLALGTPDVDTPLYWPVPGLHCAGTGLVWNEARRSLLFPYERFGLFGVAEYLDVP